MWRGGYEVARGILQALLLMQAYGACGCVDMFAGFDLDDDQMRAGDAHDIDFAVEGGVAMADDAIAFEEK